MKEIDLAQGVISHFSDQYDDIYKEVDSYGGGICDIVLKRGKILVAIEAKTSFTLKVIHQAYRHRLHASYCYVAVPRPKLKPNYEALAICRELGIGVIYYDPKMNYRVISIRRSFFAEKEQSYTYCKEILAPVYNRYKRPFLLKEYQKRSVAGSQTDRLTDFKITCEEIESILSRKGGSMHVKELFKENAFHYSSTSVARRCIVEMCNRGVIKNFKFDKGILFL